MNIRWAGLLLGGLLALPAAAHEGDTFRPFVSVGYFDDDNLFRLADGESPGTQRADRYAVYQAGINIDWKPGRQQFLVNYTQTRIRYNRNRFLDFEGDDSRATWNWRLGNRLSGNVGINQSSSQSNFDSVGLVNNAVDRKNRFARAEWEFHPRWRVGGGVDSAENTNSDPSQKSQNFEQQTYDFGVTYRTPKDSNVRALVRRTQADYPTMQVFASACSGFPFFSCPPFPVVPTLVADTSFEQTDYLLASDWRVSGKLNLRGQAGWSERSYANEFRNTTGTPALVKRPDFSGFTARVTGDWFPTAKTLLSSTLYQELGGTSDINASAVLKRGARLDAVWVLREKWRMNAGINFENRDFRGDSGLVPGLAQRNDDTFGSSLSVSYTPIRAVSLDIGVQAGRRNSNFVNEEFSYRTVFANVRADF